MTRSLLSVLFLLAAGFGLTSAAEPARPPLVCMKGFIFAETSRACVRADDDALKARGRALIEAGHFQLGLVALESIGDRRDASVLAMLGQAKRRMGQVNEAIAHFREALALEPGDAVTHGYLGETYVFIGRIDLATDERDRIEAICGARCQPYLDLAALIARETSRPPLHLHRRIDW